MEKTLEVRWFFQGMPSSIVQRWFRLQCPGKLFETQTRTDWYAHRPRECLDQLTKLKKFSSWELEPDGINLKLRQSKLELKLRQQHFGVQQFSYPQTSLCRKSRTVVQTK